jgi:hypothetical protein
MSTGDRKVFGLVLPAETFLDMARKRGEEHATYDRNDGAYRPDPLSGEWAGESVRELLGDLIDAVGDEYADDVCDAYETGYAGVWSDVDSVDVCVDCVDVIEYGGMTQAVADSGDTTREREPGVFPYPVRERWITDDVTTFSKFPCECCGSRLAGERVRVVVWVAPDSESAGA